MTKEQHEAVEKLLKGHGLGKKEINYATSLITSLCAKIPLMISKEFSTLLSVANKSATGSAHAEEAVSFNLKVKMNTTKIDMLKYDLTMTYSESHKLTDGDMQEIGTAPLPLDYGPGDPTWEQQLAPGTRQEEADLEPKKKTAKKGPKKKVAKKKAAE